MQTITPTAVLSVVPYMGEFCALLFLGRHVLGWEFIEVRRSRRHYTTYMRV
jgi:hypothetical protein